MAVDRVAPQFQIRDVVLFGQSVDSGVEQTITVGSAPGGHFPMHVEVFYESTPTPTSGGVAINSAGTAQRLVNSPGTTYRWVVLQASPNNTDYVGVGDSTVSVTSGSDKGNILAPGGSLPRMVNVDLYNVYGNAAVSAERILWNGSV